MANEISKILTKELNELKNSILENLYRNDRVASGKTAKSIRVEVQQKGEFTIGRIYGSKVLDILEEGRGKTKNASTTRTWEQELRSWMRTRGISQDAFYPIWRKINRDGYEGTKGLISDPIEKFNKGIANTFSKFIVKSVRDGINRNTTTS